ncbi:MAG: alanyl-tRNA editing protein [Promethearchaeota archaeon]|nr:MAG: alanyl-tRNA editing protein [Candidatus Lokiarchaeota archaeon]
MTRKLYWEDPYAKEFTARVVSIEKEGIVLDQTLFFPLSGNQASDKGFLKYKNDFSKSKVEKVEIKDSNIIHYVSSDFLKKIKIGAEVKGEIDWQYRYGIMRAHTSQHIFSAILLELYNAKTSRANIEFENVSIQLDNPITEEQFSIALDKLNEICTLRNKEITAEIYQEDELSKIPSKIRSKIPDKGEIRLIKINNLDLVCCGGTHLKNSTEVGPVIITDFKKGIEIKYHVGNKALEIFSQINIGMLQLSDSLNTPIFKLIKKIKSSLTELVENKQQLEILQQNNLNLSSKYPSEVYNDFNIFIFNYQIEVKLIKKSISQYPPNSLILIQMEENRYQIVTNSEKVNANDIVQILIANFGGKGGGSSFMAQASLDNALADVLPEVKNYLDSI